MIMERNADSWCLALEDCGGMPLRSFLESPRLSLDSFFKLAIQLATILADLHRQGIIHQSVNPDSILFNSAADEVCLADFSFATRAVGETRTPQSRRLLSHALAYLSPEQTGRMNRTIDYRTDFYSLGGAFYEMLTGAPPFRSDDPMELIHLHIAKTPPSLTETNPEIPEPVLRQNPIHLRFQQLRSSFSQPKISRSKFDPSVEGSLITAS